MVLILLPLFLLFLFLHLLLLAFFLVFLATLVSHACSFFAIMARDGEAPVVFRSATKTFDGDADGTRGPHLQEASAGERWTGPSRVRWNTWSRAEDTTSLNHSWNTRKAPRRSALLAGFVMVGAWAKASTKFGFATKQAARQPLKRAKARPMSE